jgi:hypothetical protein
MNNYDLEERSRRCIQSVVRNEKIYAHGIHTELVDRWYALVQIAYDITSDPTIQYAPPNITIQLPWQDAREPLRTHLECSIHRATRNRQLTQIQRFYRIAFMQDTFENNPRLLIIRLDPERGITITDMFTENTSEEYKFNFPHEDLQLWNTDYDLEPLTLILFKAWMRIPRINNEASYLNLQYEHVKKQLKKQRAMEISQRFTDEELMPTLAGALLEPKGKPMTRQNYWMREVMANEGASTFLRNSLYDAYSN